MIRMLRRAALAAATVGVLSIGAAAPAAAGYGAVAYDETTGKYGVSWNEPSQDRADEIAKKSCAAENCRVFPVEPKSCGALAMSDKGKAWGGAERETLAKAKHDAVAHCNTHTPEGKCVVRVSGCNR